MDFNDREFAVRQILLGKYYVSYRRGQYLFCEPEQELLLCAQNEYMNFTKKCEEDPHCCFLSEEEEKRQLKLEGLWVPDNDKQLEELRENIKKLRKEKRGAKYRSNIKKSIDSMISTTESEIKKLVMLKSTFILQTINYHATLYKNSWLLSHSLYTVDNKRVWSSFDDYEEDDNLDRANYFMQKAFLSGFFKEGEIRELSRTEPWRTMWRTACKTKNALFNNSGLSGNQFYLAYWSNIYDSVFESMDCPGSDVIEDDGALDNWLTEQHDKSEERFKNNKSDDQISKNPKIAGAQEVFVKVDNIEDARNVYNDLNTQDAKRIIRARQAKLSSQTLVSESELPDIKTGLQMRLNSLSKEKIRSS